MSPLTLCFLQKMLAEPWSRVILDHRGYKFSPVDNRKHLGNKMSRADLPFRKVSLQAAENKWRQKSQVRRFLEQPKQDMRSGRLTVGGRAKRESPNCMSGWNEKGTLTDEDVTRVPRIKLAAAT